MRQRVTTAIALACGPRLLIADEPTTALDVTVQKQILDLLQTQQRDRNMGMMLITHDLGVVANRADDIVVMYAGQVVERASTRTLFSSMRHPYTEALPALDPPHREPQPHAARGDPRPAARPRQPCRRVPLRPRCRYAQDQCVTENPDLFLAEQPGHEYRCFFPSGPTPARRRLAHNSAVGPHRHRHAGQRPRVRRRSELVV
jgi:peptide/nickel transport system ATP-binding protein